MGKCPTTGQVDAWAGLDPHMAKVEIDSGANFFYVIMKKIRTEH